MNSPENAGGNSLAAENNTSQRTTRTPTSKANVKLKANEDFFSAMGAQNNVTSLAEVRRDRPRIASSSPWAKPSQRDAYILLASRTLVWLIAPSATRSSENSLTTWTQTRKAIPMKVVEMMSKANGRLSAARLERHPINLYRIRRH